MTKRIVKEGGKERKRNRKAFPLISCSQHVTVSVKCRGEEEKRRKEKGKKRKEREESHRDDSRQFRIYGQFHSGKEREERGIGGGGKGKGRERKLGQKFCL